MSVLIISVFITLGSILTLVLSIYKMKELAEATFFSREEGSMKEFILMFVYALGASLGVLGFFVGMSFEMMKLGIGV